ncbi:chromate reductase [Neorhizobium sp. 2083]|uniref:NADPH-dependent FMN reductase n=1 Tax=Neorhizobium sp. 2083 TaxID=2817762 RepID=UPI00285B4812|nr:NADPH-dependent FMN reductase [Neorhizobium sp. 2083]MDR6820170.1 chromate reductase [Neorhizobium sp. 2083]
MARLTVAVIVGSARQASLNRLLALALTKLAKPDIGFDWITIRDLPIFDQEVLDAGTPPQVQRLKDQISQADALLFVTPEHNRSISAMLKNAIDWGSRPRDASVWAGKPAAITGASYGRIGTAAAQQHLRAILGCLDVAVMGLPEAFIHLTPGLITPEGDVTNEETRLFLQQFMDQFDRWASRFAGKTSTPA